MSTYKLLKTAALQLEASASELEAAQAKIAAAEQKAAAAAANTKVAAAESDSVKAGRTKLAKLAADKLLNCGMLSSTEKRDQFVTEILNHDQALTKIAKLAEHVKAPKLGSVVVDDTASKVESADDVWTKHANAALSKLNLK